MEAAVKKASENIPIFGICGGYQMLGESIADPDQVEEGGVIRGMELLSVQTVLQKEKRRCQAEGKIGILTGIFESLSGQPYRGYEIHMGKTEKQDDSTNEDAVTVQNNVYGSYVHGLFDREEIVSEVVQTLARRKGIEIREGVFEDYQTFKEKQYDKLAETLRQYLNMEEIYGMLREAHLED